LRRVARINELQIGEKIDAVAFVQRLVSPANALGEFGDGAPRRIQETDRARDAGYPGDGFIEESKKRLASRLVVDEREAGTGGFRVERDGAFAVADRARQLVIGGECLGVGDCRHLRRRRRIGRLRGCRGAESEQENQHDADRMHGLVSRENPARIRCDANT
jgi:hypothetical protein